MEVKVNETLSVEPVPGSAQLRVVRVDGGLVTVELSEVAGLVAALAELASKHTAALAGEDWVDAPF